MPTTYAGVPFRASGDPILYLSNPAGIDRAAQRDSLDALQRLNELAVRAVGDPEIAARIAAYEMAYRLQTSAPELMDPDLKRRGLLDETLVLWAGEFGRTPMVQGGNDGRDHHHRCFSLWLAGGGIKKGHMHGATDHFGFNITDGAVHVHDQHATLLHLLGLDHERLTHRFQGRDCRLTDVHGNVVREILAG